LALSDVEVLYPVSVSGVSGGGWNGESVRVSGAGVYAELDRDGFRVVFPAVVVVVFDGGGDDRVRELDRDQDSDEDSDLPLSSEFFMIFSPERGSAGPLFRLAVSPSLPLCCCCF
jgi:hypothetical protein